MQDVNRIRRALPWALPLYIGTTALALWVTMDYLVPTFTSLIAGAVAIRIGVAALLLPFLGAVAAATAVIFVLKAIPCNERVVARLVHVLHYLLFMSAGVLVFVVPAAHFFQNSAMPSLGYTKCDLLRDSQTFWFTDWIKNPEWCVSDKTLEWVEQQSRSSLR